MSHHVVRKVYSRRDRFTLQYRSYHVKRTDWTSKLTTVLSILLISVPHKRGCRSSDIQQNGIDLVNNKTFHTSLSRSTYESFPPGVTAVSLLISCSGGKKRHSLIVYNKLKTQRMSQNNINVRTKCPPPEWRSWQHAVLIPPSPLWSGCILCDAKQQTKSIRSCCIDTVHLLVIYTSFIIRGWNKHLVSVRS